MPRTSFPDTMIKQKISPKALMEIAETCDHYLSTTAEEDYDEVLRDLGWSGGRLSKVVAEINKQIMYQIAVQSIETAESKGLKDDDDVILPDEVYFTCPLWSVVTVSTILRAEDESEEAKDLPLMDLKKISYITMRVAWYPFLQAATDLSREHDKEEIQFLESWKDEETE